MTRLSPRRSLVARAALVLGCLLPGPAGAGGAGPAPGPNNRLLKPGNQGDVLELARRRMREEVKPAVLILVPQEEAARNLLAARMTQLLVGAPQPEQGVRRAGGFEPVAPSQAVDLLFSQAVFVCVPEEQARRAFPNFAAQAAVVLLDPDGRPAAALPDAPALFEQHFVAAVSEMLHGKNGERLAATARAQRAALGDRAVRVDAAVRDLDHDRFRRREAASTLLTEAAPRTTAILIEAHKKAPSLEVRRRIERLLEGVLAAAGDRAEATLPLGLAWSEPAEQANGGIVPVGGAPGRAGRILHFVVGKR